MSNQLLDVVQALVDGVNRECGLTLTKEQVVVGLPIATTANGRDTQIRLEVPSADLAINTYYRRLDLAVLMRHLNLTFLDEGEQSTHDLIPKIAARRQIPLDPSDFIDSPIVRVGQTTSVTLQAQPQSLGLRGFVVVQLEGETPEPEVPLSAILTEEGLPLFSEEGDFLLILE